MIGPVVPSIAIWSPSRSTMPSTRTSPACTSISSVAGAGHRGHAHAARDERRVGGLAALAGEDAARGVEAGDVVGLGERAHEHDVASVGGGRDRVGGGEDDLALRRARRRGDAAGEHVEVGLRVERRVQQRVELLGVDRQQRLRPVEQALVDRVDREAHRGLRGALGVARLQHVEAALLDRELGVLHVAVVALERRAGCPSAARGPRGSQSLELGDVARVAHAGDDVLALGVGRKSPKGSARR